jgi:CubicO group peptidase (beta-lactamase class C family)
MIHLGLPNMQSTLIWSILALSSACLAAAQGISNCGLLGPAYPVPTNLASTNAIKQAQTAFASLWKDSLNTSRTEWGPINVANTSISVGIFSAESNEFLFEDHHVAPGHAGALTGGFLNAETIYRIGSITKLLTVYTVLARLGDRYWNEPVTKYIPELANASVETDAPKVRWSEVALGALAGQLGGIARDGTINPY